MRATSIAVAAALLVSSTATTAGQQCDAQRPTAAEVRQAFDLAVRTSQALERSAAQVAVLGRAGQDLSAHGLRYSHVGIAYRETQPGGSARWRVVHKLNHCGTARAGIYRQGLGEFFLDRPHRYEARIAVLEPALQAALRPALSDSLRLGQVHEPAYSMVAYAWSSRYQQSNQWVIETLAAMSDAAVRDRPEAQAWLARHGYRPATVHIPAAQRLAARIGSANVAFDDHPSHLRYSGRIETVTADSVFDWLNRAYPKTQNIELRPGGNP